MHTFHKIQVGKFTHVVKPQQERQQKYEDANYRGMKMALCGVLKPGQSLETFIKQVEKQEKARRK
jgi:hypothetical protein